VNCINAPIRVTWPDSVFISCCGAEMGEATPSSSRSKFQKIHMILVMEVAAEMRLG